MPTLDWIGKRAVVNHHRELPYRLLHCDDSLGAGEAGTGNLLVEGDNLHVLKALLPYYAGKVKCIYIDPPYNTGNEGWVYNDNVNAPEIQKWLGDTVGKEAEDLSRHDKWLCMMYPRLALLREFLREDGSIWISIDDNEIGNLRAIMDEIFGRQNFRACITWQRKYSVSNNFKGIATIIDYILVYSKGEAFQVNLLARSDESTARYGNPDNDPRGPWKAVDYLNQATPEKRPNLCYDIINPNTGLVIKNTKKAWKYEPAVHARHVEEGRLWWGVNGTNTVPALKLFLSEVRQGLTPHNWWPHEEAGHTDEAKKEIERLLGSNSFDTPKPTRLIQRILQIATNPGDLVLDSFAGSGTTGHAALDGEKRQFILCEIEPRIAREITAERLRRVIDGYGEAPGRGGGFRFCTLGEPLFDANGSLRADVKWGDLAHHLWFAETGEPWSESHVSAGSLQSLTKGGPMIGVAPDGRAIYLLRDTLSTETLPSLVPHEGPRVVYGEACTLRQAVLSKERIVFKQIPYQVRQQ